MSDSELNPIAPAPEVASADAQPNVSAAQPTAGQLLNNARRAAGLSLDELATRVKVPVSRLKALEEDRFEDWPDINVVRAMAASVCRHVRLDADIVLARLPRAEKKVWSAAAAESPVGFRDKDGFTLRSSGGLRRLPLALLALVLALAAAGLYFGPSVQAWLERTLARQPLSAAAPAPAAVPEPVLPPDAGPTDTRVGAAAPETPASVSVVAAAVPVSVPVPATSVPWVSASAATSGMRAAASAPQAAASKAMGGATVSGNLAIPVASPLLVFKARGLTWVAVTDAHGVTLLRKTLAAGESAIASAASAALPLWVVVGRADNIDVEVRGQRLKLEPSTPDNVARFKVQ